LASLSRRSLTDPFLPVASGCFGDANFFENDGHVVTGAILAPHETQRLVVSGKSGKTGQHDLRSDPNRRRAFGCLLTPAAK